MKKLILSLCLLASIAAFADENEEPGNEVQVGGSVVFDNGGVGALFDFRKIEPNSGTCAKYVCTRDQKDIKASVGVIRNEDGSYTVVGKGSFIAPENPDKKVAPFVGSHESIVANKNRVVVSPWGFLPMVPTGVRLRSAQKQYMDAYLEPTNINVDRASDKVSGSSGGRVVAGDKSNPKLDFEALLGLDYFWNGRVMARAGMSAIYKPTKRSYVKASIDLEGSFNKAVDPKNDDLDVTATIGAGASF